MRSLIRSLFALGLLLSVTAVASAQAGRYVPIPVEPGGGLPISPHLPLPFDIKSDWWMYVVALVCIVGAAGLGLAIGRGLAEKGAPGAVKWTAGLGVPAPDFIHPAPDVAPKAWRTCRLMQFLAHRDPLLDPSALRPWVEQRFREVQDCWQKANYGPLGDLLLPDLRAAHERQLAAMRANGERNILSGLGVERLEFVHLDCPADPNRQEFTALITFRASSSYVDLRTDTFRHGSLVPTCFQEFWVFRRTDDAWHLAAIERSHASTRLTRPNHVEELTEMQRLHAEQCIVGRAAGA
jgi:hypothetical protein